MSATALVGLAPTILGPLTTVFTPPPACTEAVGQVDGGLLGLGLLGGGPAGNFAFLGQSCRAGKPADAASCWPASTAGAPSPPSEIGRWGVYSPGIDCPAGYATACAATAGGSSGWPLQFSLTAGETAVGCCPSGYGCANIGGQTCTMIATSTVIQTATCDGNKIGALQTSSAAAFSLYAPMIQINFQSSDLPAAATSAPGVVPVPVPGPTAGTFTTRTTTTVMAGSLSPAGSSSSSQSQTSAAQPAASSTSGSGSGSQLTTTPTTPGPEQLQTAPPSSTSSSSSSATATRSTTADLQSSGATADATSGASSGFPRLAAVGIGVGGGVAALLIGGSALLVCLRRRRNRREEESLDRLYGLGKLDSMTGSGRSDEFPGFYRGQMPTRAGGSMRQVNF